MWLKDIIVRKISLKLSIQRKMKIFSNIAIFKFSEINTFLQEFLESCFSWEFFYHFLLLEGRLINQKFIYFLWKRLSRILG